MREPRGTVNPAIPRVQRHLVNTEVQLSNLEQQEVSLNLTRRSDPNDLQGGLPILKDISGVRPYSVDWLVCSS